ncbi:MAG: glycyl-radical enzyme activating protein [Syntrophaceae bacterium]|nr:glycyl-radical enzyme activating protein [Syntrophaceae bacterium]
MTRDEKGLIFNIQKFSVHDGPGIRTTVFLKGCPLACAWCSNPESQRFTPELMVRGINCRLCGACVPACPQGAIRVSKKTGRIIDRQKCDLCLKCVDSCLYESLLRCGTSMTVSQVLAEVLQDRIFYNNSGGGVTLSGGEPLAQPDFTRELLAACKQEGLHTAIETAGIASWDEMASVLDFVDLVLFDVKHLDDKIHKKTTGVGNALILENLRKAAGLCQLWLRVPLISGFNDSTIHIQNVAKLGLEVKASKISLLPYHEGGKAKSLQQGMAYAFPEGRAPGEKHVEALRRLIEATGVPASVGN